MPTPAQPLTGSERAGVLALFGTSGVVVAAALSTNAPDAASDFLRPDHWQWRLAGMVAAFAAFAVGLILLAAEGRRLPGREAGAGRRLGLLTVMALAPLAVPALLDIPGAVAPDPGHALGLRLVLWLGLAVFGWLGIRAAASPAPGSALRNVGLAGPSILLSGLGPVAGALTGNPVAGVGLMFTPLVGGVLLTLVVIPAMLVDREVGSLADGPALGRRVVVRGQTQRRVALAVAGAKLALVGTLCLLDPRLIRIQFDNSPASWAGTLVVAVLIVAILAVDHRFGLGSGELPRLAGMVARVVAWALAGVTAVGVVALFLGFSLGRPFAGAGLVALVVLLWVAARRSRGPGLGTLAGAALVATATAFAVPESDLRGFAQSVNLVPDTTAIAVALSGGLVAGLVGFVLQTLRLRLVSAWVFLAAVAGWFLLRLAWGAIAPQSGWLNVDLWVTIILLILMLVPGGPLARAIDLREAVLALVALTLVVEGPIVLDWWVPEAEKRILLLVGLLLPALVLSATLIVRRTPARSRRQLGRYTLGYAGLASFALVLGGWGVQLVADVIEYVLDNLALPLTLLLIAAAPEVSATEPSVTQPSVTEPNPPGH